MARESVESELKIPVADLELIRWSLHGVGAVMVQTMARETNLLLDTVDGDLRDAGSLLRLRRHGGTQLLTFKGPATFKGAVKVRQEHETEVNDLAVMGEILERLGFAVFRRYEKDREGWSLGEVSVVLDHTPMGDFVEVEGPPEQLEKTAHEIGLDVSQAVQASYVGLWDEYRTSHPELELPIDMVFVG